MKMTVFSKERRSKEGKPFTSYCTQLVNKSTGERTYFTVRFKAGTPIPARFPIVLECPRDGLSAKHTTSTLDDGRTVENHTVWISTWVDTGEEYVDHSMDDYGE